MLFITTNPPNTVLMIVGVKDSSQLNKLFTILNIAVIVFIVAFGITSADLDNWMIPVNVTRLFRR